MDWRPSASLECLQKRARLLAQTRAFFAARQVLEVETPLLGRHGVTDPNLQLIETCSTTEPRYLQTSPEFAMKRLLAAGVGDLYQICKSFRAAEQGGLHNPEFTLVEWYRKNFSLQQIIAETVELIIELLGKVHEEVVLVAYADAIRQALGEGSSLSLGSRLKTVAAENGLVNAHQSSQDQLYDYIFSHVVAPTFATNKFTVVHSYPASQASLAKLDANNAKIAQRFEVFFGRVELANGFVELTDANEQLARFEQDQHLRTQYGLPQVAIDRRLIEAMRHGLPDCAGVAVGFDRIMMLAAKVTSIGEVISFDWDSA